MGENNKTQTKTAIKRQNKQATVTTTLEYSALCVQCNPLCIPSLVEGRWAQSCTSAILWVHIYCHGRKQHVTAFPPTLCLLHSSHPPMGVFQEPWRSWYRNTESGKHKSLIFSLCSVMSVCVNHFAFKKKKKKKKPLYQGWEQQWV